jgi:hypothetical protein
MHTHTIKIKDETTGGNLLSEIAVTLPAQMVSVREIIEAKVNAEIESYYQQLSGMYNGFVQPADVERQLNGFSEEPNRKINTTVQVNAAVNAFHQGSVFMLIDNIQAESLDQMIVINDKTEVSFLKLTALVGG